MGRLLYSAAFMNVILLTSSGNLSGGSRQALYLAEGLEDRGHSVHFFLPGGSQLPALAPARSFWRRYEGKRPGRAELEAAMPGGNAPVVIHAFHNAAVKTLAFWGLFWKKRAATVAHRGVMFRPGNPLPYWSPGIDRFAVNSPACGRVLRGIGVSAKRIVYVPNAVPDSRLEATMPAAELRAGFGIPDEAFVFLCIGGNKPYKGTEPLLRAFALAAREAPKAHLLLVGQVPDMWQPLADELHLAGRVHFAGQREDVGNFLRAASAFVLPSLSESMPNTLLEALRAHLPAVGTRVGAVPDLLEPENAPACGLVVPPNDVPALAGAMGKMALDSGLHHNMAGAAHIQAENFRPERRLDALEGLYRDILHSKGLI